MPDMSEFHETEDQMEGRCDAQRKSEKEEVECEVCGSIITADLNGEWYCEVCG